VGPGRSPVILGFEEAGLDVAVGIEVVGGLLVGGTAVRMALMVVEPRVRMAVGSGAVDWDSVGKDFLLVSADVTVEDSGSEGLEVVG